MWIKTRSGMIVNLDRVDYILYDRLNNKTLLSRNGEWDRELCNGDARNTIMDAIRRGHKYMEVIDCE